MWLQEMDTLTDLIEPKPTPDSVSILDNRITVEICGGHPRRIRSVYLHSLLQRGQRSVWAVFRGDCSVMLFLLLIQLLLDSSLETPRDTLRRPYPVLI